MSPRRFGDVEKITLIGGGDLMVQAATLAQDAGLGVAAVLAPRHADETLPLAEKQTAAAFAGIGVRAHRVDDINAWPDIGDVGGDGVLALCFGPSWIFAEHVIEGFGGGMINFNGIPIPRYLGGAHYTWQILNNDRHGGCFLQEITMDVDRGPILRRHDFEVPDEARLPWDYFVANVEEGRRFLRSALADMRADKLFEAVAFDSLEAGRLYFPRLNTGVNGWIDWTWSASEVELICRAFDKPYAGAGTFIRDEEVRLGGVHLEEGEDGLHPFTAGLVVRRRGDTAWAAARGGMLRIAKATLAGGGDAMDLLREGRRLHTPAERLQGALTSRPALSAKGFGENDG